MGCLPSSLSIGVLFPMLWGRKGDLLLDVELLCVQARGKSRLISGLVDFELFFFSLPNLPAVAYFENLQKPAPWPCGCIW